MTHADEEESSALPFTRREAECASSASRVIFWTVILDFAHLEINGINFFDFLQLPLVGYGLYLLHRARATLLNEFLPVTLALVWPGMGAAALLLTGLVWPPAGALLAIVSLAGGFLLQSIVIRDWSVRLRRPDLARSARRLEKLWLYCILPFSSILLWVVIYAITNPDAGMHFNVSSSGGSTFDKVLFVALFAAIVIGMFVSVISMIVAFSKCHKCWKFMLKSRRVRFSDDEALERP